MEQASVLMPEDHRVWHLRFYLFMRFEVPTTEVYCFRECNKCFPSHQNGGSTLICNTDM